MDNEEEEDDNLECILSTEYSTSSESDRAYLLDEMNSLKENPLTNERTVEGMLEEYYHYRVSSDSGNGDAQLRSSIRPKCEKSWNVLINVHSITSKTKIGTRYAVKGILTKTAHARKTYDSLYLQCEFTFDMLSSVQVKVKDWMKICP